MREIVSVGDELGIAFLGLGIQPISRLEDIEWVPKSRYNVMGPYMTRVGTMGQRMMKQTATVQVNLDYSDERDAMRKFRIGMAIAPILNAMFANSPISDGKLNGFMSFRGHIWTDTDPARCGILPFAFRDDAGFIDYVRWALDVPMYFILRGGATDECHRGPIPALPRTRRRRACDDVADWQPPPHDALPGGASRATSSRSTRQPGTGGRRVLPAQVEGAYDDDCMLGASRTWSGPGAGASASKPALGPRKRKTLLARVRGGCETYSTPVARSYRPSRAWPWLVREVYTQQPHETTIYLDALDRQLAERALARARHPRTLGDAWEEHIEELIEFAAYQGSRGQLTPREAALRDRHRDDETDARTFTALPGRKLATRGQHLFRSQHSPAARAAG